MVKEIAGRKLKNIREISGMTQEDIAKKANVTKEYVSMIESGKRLPSVDVLAKLADIFHLNISYFIEDKDYGFSMLFRAEGLNEQDKKELLKFIRLSEEYAFLEEITEDRPALAPIYQDPPPKALNSYSTLYEFAEKMANEERRRLGLGEEPIRDIFNLIEAQGAHIIRKELKECNIDGTFVFNEAKGAYILINSSSTKGRQVFTAAHEYCHYLKDRNKGPQIDRTHQIEMRLNEKTQTWNPLEIVANAFASIFLMPGSAVNRLIHTLPSNHLGPEEVIYLKRYFGVSFEAMLYRLKRLDYLREKDIEELKKIKPLAMEMALYGSSEDQVEKEYIPERFFRLSLDAYLSGKISIGKLTELWGNFLNIDVVTVKDILFESGLLRRRKEIIEEGSL